MTNNPISAELPEALRLADLLLLSGALPGSVSERAGQELRRLHSQVEALSAAQAGVPAGYVLVPLDATDAMMAAFAKAASAEVDWHAATEDERQEVRDGFGPAYRAMLTAAPQPSPSPAPAQPGQDERRGYTAPSKDWLNERLALCDDSDAQAGIPARKPRPCDAPPGCNGHNCLGCDDFKAAQPGQEGERDTERTAFKAAHQHLELDEVPDAWGRPMFKHSHVEASWLGWAARAVNSTPKTGKDDGCGYPPLPDFDAVEQHIYGACRRYIDRDMLEPIHNLIRDCIDADRAARAAPQPATADVFPPAGCGIHPISSRACERGTKGCVVVHEPATADAVDAKRYRYLRDCVLVDGSVDDELYVHVESAAFPGKWALYGELLDTAVDAKRATHQGDTK